MYSENAARVLVSYLMVARWQGSGIREAWCGSWIYRRWIGWWYVFYGQDVGRFRILHRGLFQLWTKLLCGWGPLRSLFPCQHLSSSLTSVYMFMKLSMIRLWPALWMSSRFVHLCPTFSCCTENVTCLDVGVQIRGSNAPRHQPRPCRKFG